MCARTCHRASGLDQVVVIPDEPDEAAIFGDKLSADDYDKSESEDDVEDVGIDGVEATSMDLMRAIDPAEMFGAKGTSTKHFWDWQRGLKKAQYVNLVDILTLECKVYMYGRFTTSIKDPEDLHTEPTIKAVQAQRPDFDEFMSVAHKPSMFRQMISSGDKLSKGFYEQVVDAFGVAADGLSSIFGHHKGCRKSGEPAIPSSSVFEEPEPAIVVPRLTPRSEVTAPIVVPQWAPRNAKAQFYRVDRGEH